METRRKVKTIPRAQIPSEQNDPNNGVILLWYEKLLMLC